MRRKRSSKKEAQNGRQNGDGLMVIAKVEVVAVVVVLVVDKADVGRGRGAVMELYRQANKKI